MAPALRVHPRAIARNVRVVPETTRSEAWPWDADAARGAQALLDALWHAPLAVALVDRQLRLVRANERMAQLSGAAPPACLIRRPELEACFRTGVPQAPTPAAQEWPPGSRETRHWLVSHHPVRATTGEVLAVCVFAEEVTDRRRAERSARDAADEAELAVQALIRLQAVTSSLGAALTPAEVARVVMDQAVGLLDAVAGSLSWTTEAGELEVLDAFGYPERALVAWRRFDVDLPAPLAEAFRTGEAVWLESHAAYAARYPHLATTGRPFQGATVAVPLAVRGRTFGVIGIEFDEARRFDPSDRSFIAAIAEQTGQALERARLHHEEEKLRARAERTAALLDTLFSGVPIGLAFVDWDLRLVHVNGAWARLHGAPPEAFVGQTVADALPGPRGHARAARWRQVLEGGEPVTELEDNREDPEQPGLLRTWVESAYPVVAGGDTIGVGVVAREVTTARRAEEFRRNLLGIVGHDLRNPLNAIMGFAHLLERTGHLDARQRGLVQRVLASAAKATRIAHDLLDLTRIESAHGIPLDLHACGIDAICAAVVEEVETAWPGRAVRISGRGDAAAILDPDRVAQALSNLVVNALKHGARDDRPVTLGWDGTAPREIAFRVRNRGPPIPEAIRSHLFEPFREGARPAGRASGVGLGLYIAREIARAHGGSVEGRSDDDGTTTFTLRLPRSGRA